MHITREAFTAWLDGQNPRSVVGTPYCNCDCPLARFIKSYGFTNVSVDYTRMKAKGQFSRSLPKWARQFVRQVDHKLARKITAAGTRKILRTIP